MNVVPALSITPDDAKAMQEAATPSPFDPDDVKGKAKREAAEAAMSYHEELENGDWRCRFCGNQNSARRKQILKCNMKSCNAPRFCSFSRDPK